MGRIGPPCIDTEPEAAVEDDTLFCIMRALSPSDVTSHDKSSHDMLTDDSSANPGPYVFFIPSLHKWAATAKKCRRY